MILYLQQNIAVAFFSKQIRPNFNYNGGIYYGKHKKAPRWAFVILFCLCGVSYLAQVYGGGPMLPPVTTYRIWYLYILPVLGAAVLAMVGIKRGRYDYLMLLVFELLLLAWMFVPEIIRAGGFFTPFELPIWFVVTVVSIPAIAAFILSGITYFITKMAARKKTA